MTITLNKPPRKRTRSSHPAAAVIPLSQCGVAEISEGLDFARLTAFQHATELPWEDLQRVLQIPPRTLSRRKTTGRLTATESDRLCRIARLFELASEMLNGETAASRWLQSPVRGLGQMRPIDITVTEVGAKQVELLILQLLYGVVP